MVVASRASVKRESVGLREVIRRGPLSLAIQHGNQINEIIVAIGCSLLTRMDFAIHEVNPLGYLGRTPEASKGIGYCREIVRHHQSVKKLSTNGLARSKSATRLPKIDTRQSNLLRSEMME